VSGVHAANTLGAVIGTLSVSRFPVPGIGTAARQKLILAPSVASAWLLLAPRFREVSVAIALAASLAPPAKINRTPAEVIAFGRRVATNMGKAKNLEVSEERNSSAVISQWEDGAMQIDVNGHVEATKEPFDMKLQQMVGHLAAPVHPGPKKAPGIGFGAGVSAGTLTRYKSVESMVARDYERAARINGSCTSRTTPGAM
jgi:hypothetical protein